MSIDNMKTIGLLLILCFSILSSFAQAQSHKRKIHKPAKNELINKKFETISGGILNGKALNLITPIYPPMAKTLKINGSVEVQVLIDESGKVITARAISGNSFLKPNSLKAALGSTFAPINSNDQPVRVSGIIIYNFLPNEWNWLEYGYAINDGSFYYSTENLLKTSPLEYFEGIQLLEQFKKVEDQKLIIEAFTASIKGKLSDNQKSMWLFEVGLALAKFKKDWSNGGRSLDRDSNVFQKLTFLIQNPALSGKEVLIEKIKKFIFLLNEDKTTQAFSALRGLENSFCYDGR